MPGNRRAGPRGRALAVLGLLVVLVAVAGCLEQAGRGESLENLTLEDTDEVHPGMFTAFEEGILVGAHPHAIDEPLELQVETIELGPEEAAALEDLGAAELGPFVEITARGTGQPWLSPPPETGFFVAVPVPETLDDARLVSTRFTHLGPVDQTHNGSREARGDWTWSLGAHDTDHDVYVVNAATLGGPERPTRVGVIEHESQPTRFASPYLEPLADFFTSEEKRAPSQVVPPTDDSPNRIPASEHGTRDASRARIQSVGSPSPASFSHTWDTYEWNVCNWEDDCPEDWSDPVWEDTVGISVCWAGNACPGDAGLKGFERALEGAIPVYDNLEMADGPGAFPDVQYLWNPVTEKHYLEHHIHNADTYATFTTCGEHYSGRYWAPTKELVTCLETNWSNKTAKWENTTAHELFHAFQWSYWPQPPDSDLSYPYDGVVLEATAQYSQTWRNPERLSPTTPPPNVAESMKDVTEELTGDDVTYRWQYFYYHLVADNPWMDFEDLGTIFDNGNDFEDLETALTWGGLRDAYWAFVRDLAFEGEHFGGETCKLQDSFGPNGINPGSVLEGLDPAPSGDRPEDFTISWSPSGELATTVQGVYLYAGEPYEPYSVTIETVEKEDTQEPSSGNWRMKVYDETASSYQPDRCFSEEMEDYEATVNVHDQSKFVYVIVSNMDPTPPKAWQRFTFEPLPDEKIPEAADFVVDYENEVEDWDDHDGSIYVDLLEHAEAAGGDDSLLLVGPDQDDLTGEGNWIRPDDPVGGLAEAGVDYELDSDPYRSDGTYTDTFSYTVFDEETGVTDNGTVTVERDLSPIAVNDTFEWSEVGSQVHPLDNDINPIDYDGSRYGSDTDLSIVDVFDVVGGTAVLEADEETVTIDVDTPTVAQNPFDDCPEGWTEARTSETVLSFNYTAKNTIRTSSYGSPLGEETDIGSVRVVQDHKTCVPPDQDPYHDVLQPDDPGITFDHCQAFGGAGGPMAMRMQETTRSPAGGSQVRANAYVQPDGGDWTSLAHQADAPGLAATDLSPEGVLGGWMETDAGAQAFTWDPRNGVRELRADGESIVLATHDDGQLGGYALPEDGATEGMIWLDGDPRSVGDRFHGSLVTGVDARGQAVGIHGFTPPSPGGHAGFDVDPCDPFVEGLADTLSDQEPGGFLLDFTETGDPLQGEVTDLGSLGGGTTIPAGHNDAGVVVGVSTLDRGGERAFRWTDGTMEDLGTLGGRTSFARAVDDAGNVVGTSTTRSGEERAFLWQPRDGMTEIDEAVPLPEGSTIVEATAIDDDGRISVTAETRDGIRYPLVVTGLVEGGR